MVLQASLCARKGSVCCDSVPYPANLSSRGPYFLLCSRSCCCSAGPLPRVLPFFLPRFCLPSLTFHCFAHFIYTILLALPVCSVRRVLFTLLFSSHACSPSSLFCARILETTKDKQLKRKIASLNLAMLFF